MSKSPSSKLPRFALVGPLVQTILLAFFYFGPSATGLAQSLQLVNTVPGTIFDTDGQRVLYLFNNGLTSNMVIRDLMTGAETNLPSVPNQTPQYGFLGPRTNPMTAPQGGGIFVTEGQDVTVNELFLITASNVAINVGKLDSLGSLRVAGNYAVWNGSDAGCSVSYLSPTLYRTDLRDGTTLALAGPCSTNSTGIGNIDNDVASSGAVVAWAYSSGVTAPYNIIRFDGNASQYITTLTGNIYSVYPRTDGQSHLYIREQACCNSPYSRLILNRGGIETILRDGSGSQRANPDDDYRINSGWVAFRGLDASITLISPAGFTGKVAPASDKIVYLASDGTVAFLTGSTATGITLYISNGDAIAGTQVTVPVGNFRAAYKVASIWYFHDSASIYSLDTSGTASATVVAAVLPTARATQDLTTVTAFATIINTGNAMGDACFIGLPSNVPAQLLYQTTNAQNVPVGVPGPVAIAAGASQGFYFAITPSALFSEEIPLIFQCANSAPAPSVSGLNTILITAQATQPPDMLSIAATVTNDGIMNIPGPQGTGVFSVATIDIGTAGAITFTTSDSPYGQQSRGLPLTTTLCQTDPTTGACLSTPATKVNINVTQKQILTFTIFSAARGTAIPFDPANNRIFFVATYNSVPVGETSVAVRTP
jgi:hypothetical protein